MEIQFINGKKFEDFIKEHATMEDSDMSYYINSLVLNAYRGNSSYKLWSDEAKNGQSASIHYEYDLQKDEEQDEEYLVIKF